MFPNLICIKIHIFCRFVREADVSTEFGFYFVLNIVIYGRLEMKAANSISRFGMHLYMILHNELTIKVGMSSDSSCA